MPTSTFRNVSIAQFSRWQWPDMGSFLGFFSSLYLKSWEQDEQHSKDYQTLSHHPISASNHCIASIYIFVSVWASPRENQLYIWKEGFSLFRWLQDREFQSTAYSCVNINCSTNRSQLWHEPSHCQMTQSKSAHRNLYCCCINTLTGIAAIA